MSERAAGVEVGKEATEHTPGPWTNSGFIILESHGIAVAEALDRGTETPCMVANSRLIAAAPELLDSLTEFVALANFDADSIPKTTEEWDAMVAKAEAVIRKAKGIL